MQTEPANTPQELNPETAQPEEPQAEPKKEKEPASLKMEIMSWIVTLVAAIVIATLMRVFIFEPIRVDGTSMTNTLKDGEVVYASKLAYRFGDVEYNDIVICRYPNRMGKSFDLGASLTLQNYTLFVKRIVALPGDTLAITNGQLIVNGEVVPNPEFMGSEPRDFAEITLGKDEYFALGDNRFSSHDSRHNDVGPISRDMIMGQVQYVMWPLNAIRSVK
jgi:signal peptidase I